jgi:futalosine hydrolase
LPFIKNIKSVKVLIVVATKDEVQPLLDISGEPKSMPDAQEDFVYFGNHITVLCTGVGMVNTAIQLTNQTTETDGINDYDIAINAGICGCFDKTIDLGTVVNVTQDCFSELGAEDGDDFHTVEELNLGESVIIPSERYKLENIIIESLPKVNGITVNTVHGNKDSIAKVVKKFNPTVESMEGAAFMQCCDWSGLKHVQLRAVSNYVEVRNKDNWNIPLAIKNLNNTLINILETL